MGRVVRSRVTVPVALEVLPAVSLAETCRTWVPSAVTGDPLTNGLPSSVALSVAGWGSLAPNVGATEALFEYWPSATPDTEITGGTESRTTATWRVEARP